VADDFLPTITALLDRPQPPEHNEIETSGLALPKPPIRAFNWPEVRTRVTVDGVIAVVDGPAAAAGRFADNPEAVAAQRAADDSLDHESPLAELFEDQINSADLIILNKNDQMSPGDRTAARDVIDREMKRKAKLVLSSYGAIDPDVLLGLGAAAEDDLDTRFSHHELEGEDHDHDEFESFQIAMPALKTPEELLERLKPAIARHDILRVKGFLDVAGRDMRLVLQGVGGRIQHYYDRAWGPDEQRAGRLVVIGLKGLDRAAIEAAVKG
jgi:cobalamin biosynthesis protein CobW